MLRILMVLCVINLSHSTSSAMDFFHDDERRPEPVSIFFADPFSEIETAEDDEYEEALERFYAYGRIMHLSAYFHFVNTAGAMSDVYTLGGMAGVRVSYFIDWDLALTFNFGMGKMGVDIININPATGFIPPTLTGGGIIGNLGLGLKYYINFYDISRAIAYFNPAITIGGEFTVIDAYLDNFTIRELERHGIDGRVFDHTFRAPGVFFGFSMEFPIFRKSIYLGAEFMYHLTFFPRHNDSVPVNDPTFDHLIYTGHLMTYGISLIWNL